MSSRGQIKSGLASLLASLCVGVWADAAFAQESRGLPTTVKVAPELEGIVQPYDIQSGLRQSRLRLFGEGDRAWTSLRGVGSNILYTTNTGPLDDIDIIVGSGLLQTGTAEGSGFQFQTFGMGLTVGAPRSEWVALITEGVEELANAQGGGWTTLWNGEIFNKVKDLNAADGLLGSLLNPSARSTEDGTCFDHSAGLGGVFLDAGFQLLPGSNCTPTWSLVGGNATWAGTRPVTPEGWVEHFNTVGSAGFEFNDWQVPEEFRNLEGFLGNNFHTYGHFNDYNSTARLRFGNAIPGGSGDPSIPGWPMGLDFHFDAFTFSVPTVANTMFYRMLVVNNSEALYGVMHDYDSVYVGLNPWPGRNQDGDNYMIPELGAWVSAESSSPADCAARGIDPIPVLNTGCGGFDPTDATQHDFLLGAHGIVVLKSPIGDLRNKLFTRVGSPFFAPGHLLAGDTITFNHSVNWNFGNWAALFQGGSIRQQFGVISSTRQNVLDDGACTDIALSTRYRLFQPNNWRNDQADCLFKAWAPGWTHVSHRPLGAGLGPDTLRLAGCGVDPDNGSAGCPQAWSDSTIHGWSNVTFGNLSQMSLGPFRLEAGDTAQLLFAIFSQRDSASFEAELRGIVDFYLNLFAGPEAPPPVAIREVSLGAGIQPGQDASVRLVWDDAAEDFVDPFLSKFADDMEVAPDGTDLARLRDQNPGLVARIRERAADNLQRLLLFKSCDAGLTFTSDEDCDGDPARDAAGNAIGAGWEALARFEPDAAGELVNTFTDASVTPGVTYLYVMLGETRGAAFEVADDESATIETTPRTETVGTGDGVAARFSGTLGFLPIEPGSVIIAAGGNTVQDNGAGGFMGDTANSADPTTNIIDYQTGEFDVTFATPPTLGTSVDASYNQQFLTCGIGACEARTLTIAPSLLSPLTRSAAEPNVVVVYVPASGAAGGSLATVEFLSFDTVGLASAPFQVAPASADISETEFRTIFGNRIVVIEEADSATGAHIETRVIVEDQARTVVGDAGTTTTVRALATDTFVHTGGAGVTRQGLALVSDVFAGGVRTRTFEAAPNAAELNPDSRFAKGLVLVRTADNVPLLATATLGGDVATPGSFLGRPDFPGFIVSADNSNPGRLDAAFYIADGELVSGFVQPTLRFDATLSRNDTVQAQAWGEYAVTFADRSFGPLAPFTLNFTNRAQTDAQVDQSLAQRGVGTLGATDAATDSLVAARLGLDPAAVDLVAAEIPFTVRNVTRGRATARLAMVDRDTLQIRLGTITGTDTLSVTIAPEFWVPNDRLFVIETVTRPRVRTVGGELAIVVDPAGSVVLETGDVITFSDLRINCGSPNTALTCNPVRGAGSGGWIDTQPDDELHFVLRSPFVPGSQFTFIPRAAVQGDRIVTEGRSIRAALDSVQVVPNPYVVFSAYEQSTGQRRLLFTHLPPEGVLRVYTVSGRFVQQLRWTAADLSGNGDLFWNMQTREGNDLAGGLYIYVIEAVDPATSSTVKKLGKFVVIR